jgi:voltage-gated potassium channel
MTTPDGTTADPPPAKPRLLNLVQKKPLTARRAARIIASVTVSITIISGVLMHFTDEQTFPTIGAGLWWAIQTVTTVGYGDLVPTNTVGRLVAALVMVVGIGFLTVVTAAISSSFIESTRRRLHGNETDPLSAKLDQIGARLEVIEAGLKDLGRHDQL